MKGYIMAKIELKIEEMREIVSIIREYEQLNSGRIVFPNRLEDQLFSIEMEYQSYKKLDEHDWDMSHDLVFYAEKELH